MRIPPRFRSTTDESSQRRFTDREEELELCRRAVRALRREQQTVLNFYGVGGIGKSRLQRELQKIVRAEFKAITTRLDLQSPAFRKREAAIYQLAHRLRSAHKLHFPRFDIAYASYWQRTNPQLAMTERGLPLLSESEILQDVLAAVPGGGTAHSVIRLLDRLSRKSVKWKRIREDEDLRQLDGRDPHELLEDLTYFFARDLVDHLASTVTPCVLFFDALEALWDDLGPREAGRGRDAWLRDLITRTPGVLHVVSSRDAVTWANTNPDWAYVLVPHLVGDFCFADALEFLGACGLVGQPAEAAANVSMGVPFYLNLCVDHFIAEGRDGHVAPESFGSTHEEIMNRFIGHLPRTEEQLLKLLSVPRYWDRSLFIDIARSFGVGEPSARWEQLCSYSFNSHDRAGRWQMHQLMRTELAGRLDADVRREIDETLFASYCQRVDRSSLTIRGRALAFREATYHGLRANRLEVGWFRHGADLLMYRGLATVVSDVLDELDAFFQGADNTLAGLQALQELVAFYRGWIFQRHGRLADALQIFEVLQLNLLADVDLGIRFQIANAMRESGKLVEAGLTYEELWNRQPGRGDEELHRLIGIQYADFHYVQGRFCQAVTILDAFTSLDDQTHPKEVAEALRVRGHVHRFNVSRDRGLADYQRAGQLFESCGDELGQALICTNVAEALSVSDPHAALVSAADAIRLHENLGMRLEVGKAFIARGIACLVLGRLTEAQEAASHAVSIEVDVGYRFGQAQARLLLAFVLAAQRNPFEALAQATEAVGLLEASQGYPTLRILASLLASELGSNELNDAGRRAEAEVEWLHPGGKDRLVRLARTLLASLGPREA